MKRILPSALAAAAVVLSPSIVFAHPGTDGGAHHFAAGLVHPFTGLDHILALVAIGVWALQLDRRVQLRVLGAFLAATVVGGSLAWMGVAVPLVESAIIASVIIMGLLVAFPVRMRDAGTIALVAAFALFHGYAHASELPSRASIGTFGAGFIIGSTILLAIGFGIGWLLGILSRPAVIRALGAMIAAAGVLLALG